MQRLRCYDLFITHAWRFHDDWIKFSELLDKTPNVNWRNFSLPWHDPAMNANTEIGGKFIRDFLEAQIIPVHAVILLTGVYSIASARRWIDFELEIARKYKKPLICIPPVGDTRIPDEIVEICNASCGWDSNQLFFTIDQILV